MTRLIVNATYTSSKDWRLHVENEGTIHVSRLDRAAQHVRIFLDARHPETDHSNVEIVIIPEIGPLGDEVNAARAATRHAAAATIAAATQSRAAARNLIAAGYSIADAAVILGISRGRVSQLANS